jgi:hypothetical protein
MSVEGAIQKCKLSALRKFRDFVGMIEEPNLHKFFRTSVTVCEGVKAFVCTTLSVWR